MWKAGARTGGRPTLLASAALVVALAACGGGDDGETPPSRPAAVLVEETAVTGGSARERTLLRRVVAGIGRSTLRRVEIGPREGRRDTDGGRAVPVAFTVTRGVNVRRQWDEWIVAGAFSRRLLAARLDAEVDAADDRAGFTARPKLADEPDPRRLGARRERALVAEIRAAARRARGSDVRLEVHSPFAPAVTLALSPRDPARFLLDELRPLLRRLEPHRSRLEGIYVAVLDGDGDLVLEWGSWTRNPAGSYWVRRDLTNCSPIAQSEPPGGDPPPPCEP